MLHMEEERYPLFRDGATLLRALRDKGEEFWITRGEEMALYTFHQAAERVPAYKNFLKQQGIRHDTVKTIADFKKIPVIDKDSYILNYPLRELVWDGTFAQGMVIAQSSGTTREPFFWPRL